jgi:hypothetical protein
MFDDHLLQICEREFEAKVKRIFEANRQSGKKTCEVPYLGGEYCTERENAELQVQVVDALLARQRFEWTGPTWVDALPLHADRIAEMQADADPRLQLVALYARSLDRLQWNYKIHPEFKAYACGLMACSYAPKELRQDRKLLQEFPPKKLAGLADGWLQWRTHEEIAADRKFAAWLREMPVAEDVGQPEPDIRHRAGHC